MEYFLERMKKDIAKAVAGELGVAEDIVQVAEADEKFDADMAVPCFVFAKELSRNPVEIAEELAGKITHEKVEKIEAVAGYVNFKIRAHCYAMGLAKDLKEVQTYGATDEGSGETAVVDFIGLNLSKPFSVGHLRPTVQGWALIQLLKLQGYEVVGDSHLGDWGTPFGMWVVAYEIWGDDARLERDGVYELGRLYVEFRKAAENDETMLEEAKTWLKKLEESDEEALAFKERFSKISLEHMNSVLDRLGVKADENLSESFYIEGAQKLVDELVENNQAIKQEDGSVIIDLTDEGIETPILLRKSDGSALYATSDLETIRYRKERWNPSKIVYSVGAEQQFHFNQVFAAAKKLGYVDNTELAHPWFGTIDELDEESGKRSKMSSRKSTAMLDNLLDLAEEKAGKVVKQDISESDTKKIAVGAIKFNDFAQSRRTNILFDWDKMFSFTGYSSVYIQYAAVRIGSILAGLEQQENVMVKELEYDWNAENELLATLSTYPGVVTAAAAEYEPNLVTQYLYELARKWNKYYETTSVKDSEGDALVARTWLIKILRQNLNDGLGLLGIEVPQKM